MRKALSLLLAPIFLIAGEWADETLSKLTLEEKVGQLFMVSACPTRGYDHWLDWQRLIDDCHVGSLLIKSGDVEAMKGLIQKLQHDSPLPLLVAADAEWGLGMTSSAFLSYPRNMTLGAISDPKWIEKMGEQIGQQCRAMGIHMNLAPVADVNNNPQNPIIHMRSFGEDPAKVADKAFAYAQGLQQGGILACAKHFPGHGDTAIDSHYSLPTIPFNRKRLNDLEFIPFQRLIDSHVDAIMTAHLLAPALDPILPSSLSPACLDVLRRDLGFRGLVITDALNMQGVAAYYSTEEIATRAHLAGNDLLLYGSHIAERVDEITRKLVPRAYSALLDMYRGGDFPLSHLDQTVLRILEAKEKTRQQISISLDQAHFLTLKAKLFEEAVTVVRDEERMIPLLGSTAYLGIGNPDTDLLAAKFRETGSMIYKLGDEITPVQTLVIALHDIQPRAEQYGLTRDIEATVGQLSREHNVILCLFGTPYALRYFEDQKAIIVVYEDAPEAQEAVWRVLQGEIEAKGQLPVK